MITYKTFAKQDNFDSCLQFLENNPDITNIALPSPYPDVKIKTKETIAHLNNTIDQLKALNRKIWVSVDLHQAILGGDDSQYYVVLDIFDINEPPNPFNQYIDAIRERINDIERINITTNPHLGTGGYSRWITEVPYVTILQHARCLSIPSTLEEMKKIASFAPGFLEQKKISFLDMIEVPFEREAFLFQDKLPEAPILNWIKENDIAINIGRGAWALDRDLEEHYKWYMVSHVARSPVLVHKQRYDAGDHPYEYYQQYLRKAKFYSGIGYDRGIKRGNDKNLLDIGYKGVWMLSSCIKDWLQHHGFNHNN